MKNIGYDPKLPQDNSVYEYQCPVIYALDIIGGKWKLPILWHLADKKTVRYNELKRSVKGITNMMLTKCLRELEENGLVNRIQFHEVPPHVEYSLTDRANHLLPALKKLYKWGKEQIKIMNDLTDEKR